MTYQQWIDNYLRGLDSLGALGMCGPATAAMQLEFPELRRARGYVYDACWGDRTHWWCVAPDGEIVDPTASQFPALVTGSYQELGVDDPIPSGRCPNCGDTVYDGATFCNDRCYSEMVSSL